MLDHMRMDDDQQQEQVVDLIDGGVQDDNMHHQLIGQMGNVAEQQNQ